MKNLRIGSKLLVSFGGILFLVAALSWFAVSQLGSMNALMGLAVRDRLPKVMLAQDIESATSGFRVGEGQHILATSPDDMRSATQKLDASRAIIETNYRRLDETLKKPQARTLLAQYRTAWDAYLGQSKAVLALSEQNKNAEASALMRGTSQQLFAKLTKAADELAAFEATLATDSGDEGDALFGRARTLLLAAVVVVLAGLGAILVTLVKQIAKPVAAVTGALGELAAGRMDVAVPTDARADEVGDLAKAMTGLRDQLAAAERAKAEQIVLIVDSVGKGLSGLADGDLVSRIDVDLTGPFAKLKTDFNAAAAALQATMTQMADSAGSINTGAAEIRHASDDLSQRTEQQAASLEETAAAMDEITATVRSTAERAGQANGAVAQAREEAEHSGEVVRSAVDAMGGIERTSNEISEIIAVIDGIAFQTNLLALNAGVEAARAGDAGKGFAVVASEVRALAQRSAEAAKDVKTRITASSEQVAAGVQLVGETGRALGRIVERIGEIRSLVSEIATSAEQQASGLTQVNTAVGEMDGVTQQNAAMVEQATAAARSLAAEADGMSRQIARFRTGDAPAAPASPVHQLQERAAGAGRQIARAAPRRGGGSATAAVAVADDDWSQF